MSPEPRPSPDRQGDHLQLKSERRPVDNYESDSLKDDFVFDLVTAITQQRRGGP